MTLHFPESFRRAARATGFLVTAAAFAFAPRSGSAQRDQTGSWKIQFVDTDNRVQLQLEDFDSGHGRSSTGSPVSLSTFEGLSAGQLRGSSTDAHFRLKRDAGTFAFDGRVGYNRGAGQFAFTPDPKFASGVASRGYSRPGAEEQFQLALYDIGFSYLDEVKSQGYGRPSIDDLVTAGRPWVHKADHGRSADSS